MYTCIKKYRDKNNKIVKYGINDINNKYKEYTPDELKKAIKNNKIYVSNLVLTSDNRLIDKHKPEDEKLKLKLKVLGYNNVKVFNTFCKHYIYLGSKSDYKHILYIPNNVKLIYSNYATFPDIKTSIIFKNLMALRGTLDVVGGEHLKSTRFLFYQMNLDKLNLSKLNTKNVINMRNMISNCSIKELILDNFNTEQVKDMSGMFSFSSFKNFDISTFNTKNVKYMQSMFANCSISKVDLSHFNTDNIEEITSMFWGSFIDELNLTNFNTSKVKYLGGLFDTTHIHKMIVQNKDIIKEAKESYFKGEIVNE